MNNEFHNITLSGTIEVPVLTSALFHSAISFLSLHVSRASQGFGLATPDPFSSCEVGGILARERLGQRNHGGYGDYSPLKSFLMISIVTHKIIKPTESEAYFTATGLECYICVPLSIMPAKAV